MVSIAFLSFIVLPCCVFVIFDQQTNDKHEKFLRKVCFTVVQYGGKLLAVGGIATRPHAEQPIIHIVHSPTKALLLNLEWFKIYTIMHSNIAPTCFGLHRSSGSLY
jgi:hypothetical protein